MKEYPVGSVCVIVNTTGKLFEEFIGKECTILEGIAEQVGFTPDGRPGKIVGYLVQVQGRSKQSIVEHVNLKLKRYPGQLDSWATEKVKQIFTPNPKLVEETV
jgi:hypothetical protein